MQNCFFNRNAGLNAYRQSQKRERKCNNEKLFYSKVYETELRPLFYISLKDKEIILSIGD